MREKNYLSDGNQCCHLQGFIRVNLILLMFDALLFFHEHPVFTSRHSATSRNINNNQHSRGKIKSRVEFTLFRESLCRICTGFSETAVSITKTSGLVEVYCIFPSQILQCNDKYAGEK